MIIEALIAVTFAASIATLLAPDRVAGRLAAALSLLPVVGSLYMWSRFDATGNALMGGDIAFETGDLGGTAAILWLDAA